MTANRKKFLIIAAVATAVALIAGAIVYLLTRNTADERAEDPEKYISLALQNTYGLVNIPGYDSDWIFDILNGRHQLELGLAFKDIDVDLPVDRQMLSMVQLARLDVQAVRDPAEKTMQAGLVLAGGGATMLSGDLYMSDTELAIRLPQGFDYFITLDPRRAVSDWEESDLGAVAQPPEGVTDATVYDIYKNLFSSVAKPAKLQLINDTVTLYKEAEYGFISAEDGVYCYSLRLKCDSFNAWFRSLVQSMEDYEPFRKMDIDISQLYNFSVTDDLDITLNVADDIIVSADISTLLQNDVACHAVLDPRGEANPFDKVFAGVYMENPNGGEIRRSESFDIAGAINPYLMLEEMPGAVGIEITHRGDSQNPDLFLSEAEIVMSAGDDRTEIAWNGSWDMSGDALDNFKLNAGMTVYADEETAGFKINVLGSVLENREKAELLSNFSDISWYMTDFDESEQGLGITLKLNLKSAPDAAIDYDRTDVIRLAELSPLRLLQIYAGFKADPVIGALLE